MSKAGASSCRATAISRQMQSSAEPGRAQVGGPGRGAGSDDRRGAAVHVDRGSGGETGEVGAQEAGHGGEFLCFANASDGNVGAHLRPELIVRNVRRGVPMTADMLIGVDQAD